ncbi:DUF3576 domain-containing protein [Candidatus Pelagibacter sp.]|uniref:DUF3576 domain-containing protein n=1 Tax=Candidatus Pelagibacter sp. TaxID=2024849 RepID=UPI003F82B996
MFSKRLIVTLLSFLVFLPQSACGPFKFKKVNAEKDVPINVRERVKKNIEEGRGFRLMNQFNKNTYDFASSNPLWRATLDTLDFMPLASANYSGGIVITDWYSENNTPNESVKISVRFLTNEIRSDALDIDIFLKKCSDNLTNCSISKNNTDLVADLNFNILKKAAKYEKEIIEKYKKENPYEIGDGSKNRRSNKK